MRRRPVGLRDFSWCYLVGVVRLTLFNRHWLVGVGSRDRAATVKRGRWNRASLRRAARTKRRAQRFARPLIVLLTGSTNNVCCHRDLPLHKFSVDLFVDRRFSGVVCCLTSNCCLMRHKCLRGGAGLADTANGPEQLPGPPHARAEPSKRPLCPL